MGCILVGYGDDGGHHSGPANSLPIDYGWLHVCTEDDEGHDGTSARSAAPLHTCKCHLHIRADCFLPLHSLMCEDCPQ